MLRKPVESLDEALANIAGAIDKAVAAGKFMAAVWMVKDGRIELVHRETWDFQTGDFEVALTHLRNNLEEEKKLLEVEKKPEPLPLGEPFLRRLRGAGEVKVGEGPTPAPNAFDAVVKPPSLLGNDEPERKEKTLEEMGFEKVPEKREGSEAELPATGGQILAEKMGSDFSEELKEEPNDEKDSEGVPGVEGGEGRGEEGVEGGLDGPPVQA